MGKNNAGKLIMHCKKMQAMIQDILFKHYTTGKIDLILLQRYRELMNSYDHNIVEMEKRLIVPFKGEKFDLALTVTVEMLLEIIQGLQNGDYSKMDQQIALAEVR